MQENREECRSQHARVKSRDVQQPKLQIHSIYIDNKISNMRIDLRMFTVMIDQLFDI